VDNVTTFKGNLNQTLQRKDGRFINTRLMVTCLAGDLRWTGGWLLW
jgi:hypothetical protein